MDIGEVLRGFREDRIPWDRFLRAVAHHPAWHLPVDQDDHPVLWTLGGRDFIAAQSSPRSPDGSDSPWMVVDGHHLLRNLPSDCAGVVFDLGTPAACVIDLDECAAILRDGISVLDVEGALLNPAPGQALTLLEHEWLLLVDATGQPLVEEEWGLLLSHVFSADDRLGAFLRNRPVYRQASVVRIPGRDMFAQLAQRTDYDAIAVHYGEDSTETFGPRAAALFSAGVDGRTTARVLPARTIAELHLFLDLEGASREGRVHQLQYLGERLVARYTGTVAGSRRTWWFEPVEPTDDPLELGAGPSAILCAGQLADLVRRRLRALSDQGSGSQADDRKLAAGAARWAREVEKMLSDGELPRSAVRSPDGSRYLREFPEMATQAWIVDARRRAEAMSG